jgi:inner membrane protein
MMWKTHLAFGILCGILITNYYTPENLFLFFVIISIGSLLPDIDKKGSKANKNIPLVGRMVSSVFKHRGIFHSIFVPIALLLALVYIDAFDYALPLIIGYMSHLLIDSITKEGVNFIHPISQLRVKGFVETGSILETIIFIGLSVVIVMLLI